MDSKSIVKMQDTISCSLNNIMNGIRAKKESIELKWQSKLLKKVLGLMKEKGYIDIEEKDGKIVVILKKINECKAIKPRFFVQVKEIDKYVRRYLPARDFGFLIISTPKGLMTHSEAIRKNLGGSLIAYCY